MAFRPSIPRRDKFGARNRKPIGDFLFDFFWDPIPYLNPFSGYSSSRYSVLDFGLPRPAKPNVEVAIESPYAIFDSTSIGPNGISTTVFEIFVTKILCSWPLGRQRSAKSNVEAAPEFKCVRQSSRCETLLAGKYRGLCVT